MDAALERLELGLERLRDKDNWYRGRAEGSDTNKGYCMISAIGDYTGCIDSFAGAEYAEARRYLWNARRELYPDFALVALAHWNDRYASHEQVVKVYQLAIQIYKADHGIHFDEDALVPAAVKPADLKETTDEAYAGSNSTS